MPKELIPHNAPSFFPLEKAYINEVLQSGCLVNGQFTKAFEDEVCQYLGLPQGHSVAVSSGSAALFLALTAIGAKNKSIAMQSYVCSSLKQAALLANAQPKILDIEKDKTTIDQNELDNSGADVLIHPYLFGQASFLPQFKGRIIEDCAQALGAKVNNQYVGTIGDIGILSFYATKLITSAGQGGMVISKNINYIEAVKDYINYDMRADNKPHFNFPFSEVQAAAGLAQLRGYSTLLDKRNSIWDIYQQYELPLINDPHPGLSHVRYRAILRVDNCSRLMSQLAQRGIKTIVPIEDWELLDKQKNNSLTLTRNLLSIPLYPSLQDAEFIAKTIKELL